MANLLSTIISGRLSIGSSSTTPYLTEALDGIVFGGNEAGYYYRLYTKKENYGGDYTKLNIAWHTGIKIGSYYGYGGIRFYNNSPEFGTEVFSVAKGDSHVRVENNLYVGNTIYNNGNAVIHSGNIGSQSVSYASESGITEFQKIPDHRGNAYIPNDYAGNRVWWHFNNKDAVGGYGTYWHAIQTVSPWSSYDSSHRQQQIQWGGTDISFRYATAYNSWSPWYRFITDASIASQSVSYADESGYSASTGTTDNIGGVQFRNTGSNAGTNADTIDSNGITYYTSGVSNFSGNATDGALYSQRYSNSWQHQIAGDYRSGMIAVRGRNNGTWTSWRTIIDSSTIGSQSVSVARQLLSPNDATVVAADSAMPSTGHSFIHTLALGPGGNDGHILGMSWAGTTSIYGAQIFLDTDPNDIMAIRSRSSTGVWTSWKTVIHSGTIGSQSVNYAASAGDSTNLDGRSSSKYLYYRGISTTGDFQSFQSSESIIRFDQVNNYNGLSNPPGGYNYGGVLSMRGDNFGFQIWGSHVGDLYYKTQWGNDQYSGWRYIVHSGNIGSQSVSYANTSTNLYASGGAYIKSSTSGTSYSNHIQVREADGGSSNSSSIYEPALGFHWSGVVASNIAMESSGRIAIKNNPGTSYENFIANGIYGSIFYDSGNSNYYVDPNSTTSGYFAGVLRQNDGKYVRDAYYRTISGYGDLFSGGSAGWTTIAEITLAYNCGGAVLYGTLYDHRYDGADAYQLSIVARSECDFTSNNSSHYINVGCTITGSTAIGNYRDKIRVLLVYAPDGARTYELQVYETAWNHNTWQLESTGWTIHTSAQSVRTGLEGEKVNYISNQNADYQRANEAMYSPIYYDSADTGYYLNPNSASILNDVRSYRFKNINGVSTDDNFGLYFGAGDGTAYAIYRETGSWAYPYPDLRIAFHTGIKIGAAASYEGIRFYTDYDMSTQVMSVNNGSDPLGGGNVYVNNSLQAGSSLRAPIFYDSADTAFYVDPNSNSKLVNLGLGGATPDLRLSVSGDIHMDGYIYQGGTAGVVNSWGSRTVVNSGNYVSNARSFAFNNVGYGSSWTFAIDSGGAITTNRHIDANTTWTNSATTLFLGWYGGKVVLGNNNNGMHDAAAGLGGNTVVSTNPIYATIYYDLQDTTYYCDPNGTSQLSSVLANNWFRPQGNTGLYFSSYSRGIWAADSAGASYGNVSIYGDGINSWPGYAINNLAIFMARDTRRGIFIPSADSWLIRYEESNNSAFVDFDLQSGSDIRYKSNIKRISGALDKVKQLKGVTYNYKGNERTSIGFIAQEVEPILPEVVSTDADGFKGIGYANIVALLSEAIKEQQVIIEQLKARIDILESK